MVGREFRVLGREFRMLGRELGLFGSRFQRVGREFGFVGRELVVLGRGVDFTVFYPLQCLPDSWKGVGTLWQNKAKITNILNVVNV